jgi:hypothetical protein
MHVNNQLHALPALDPGAQLTKGCLGAVSAWTGQKNEKSPILLTGNRTFRSAVPSSVVVAVVKYGSISANAVKTEAMQIPS